MQCALCGKKIPLLRKLTAAAFCSEAHRDEYQQRHKQLALSRLMDGMPPLLKPDEFDDSLLPMPSEFVALLSAEPEIELRTAPGPVTDPLEIRPSKGEPISAEGVQEPPSLWLNTPGLGTDRTRSQLPLATLTAPADLQPVDCRSTATEEAAPVPATAAADLSTLLDWTSRQQLEGQPLVELQETVELPATTEQAGEAAVEEIVAAAEAAAPETAAPEAATAEELVIAEEVVTAEAVIADAGPAPELVAAEAAVVDDSAAVQALTEAAPAEVSLQEAAPVAEVAEATNEVAQAAPPVENPPTTTEGFANFTTWPASWRRRWSPQRCVLQMRMLWPHPSFSVRDGRRRIPEALRGTSQLRTDGDPLVAASDAGAGLVSLRPPRPRPPMLAAYTPPAQGERPMVPSQPCRVSPRALRPAVVGMPFAEIGHRLLQPALGNRAAREVPEPKNVTGRMFVRRRPLTTEFFGTTVPCYGRLSTGLNPASRGTAVVWISASPILATSAPAVLGTLTLPPTHFRAPLSDHRAAGLHPISPGGKSSWLWRGTVEPLALLAPRRRGVTSKLRPDREWLPVIARVVLPPVILVNAASSPLPGPLDTLASTDLSDAKPRRYPRAVARTGHIYGRLEATIDLMPLSPPQPVSGDRGFQSERHVEPTTHVRHRRLDLPVISPAYKKRLAGVSWLGSTWQRVPTKSKWATAIVIVAGLGMFALPPPPSRPRPAPVVEENTQRAERTQKADRGQKAARKLPIKKASLLDQLQDRLEQRAAVAVTDDFSHGLTDWRGRGDWAATWSYDPSGFVRTGAMALYAPTLDLYDYRMEFVGGIDRRSIGWIVRGRDLQNYYAIKLQSGPGDAQDELILSRHTVVGGAAGRNHEVRVRLRQPSESMLRIVTDVRGSEFSVTVQGQQVDSWTETRLPKGGVGFFSNRGEQARIRWVGVWHQYDTLGKLCAYLSASSLLGREGGDNP